MHVYVRMYLLFEGILDGLYVVTSYVYIASHVINQ